MKAPVEIGEQKADVFVREMKKRWRRMRRRRRRKRKKTRWKRDSQIKCQHANNARGRRDVTAKQTLGKHYLPLPSIQAVTQTNKNLAKLELNGCLLSLSGQ